MVIEPPGRHDLWPGRQARQHFRAEGRARVGNGGGGGAGIQLAALVLKKIHTQTKMSMIRPRVKVKQEANLAPATGSEPRRAPLPYEARLSARNGEHSFLDSCDRITVDRPEFQMRQVGDLVCRHHGIDDDRTIVANASRNVDAS